MMKHHSWMMVAAAAVLLTLVGCERKNKKPDQNEVRSGHADDQSAADETSEAAAENTAGESTDETAADAQPAIPNIGDDQVNPALLKPATLDAKAPSTFRAVFKTTAGDITVEFHRDWAPNGVDRVYNLIEQHYYDGVVFFRVVEGFMAQFGIHPNPKVSAAWQEATIADDPVEQPNTRGRVTFAKQRDPNTRTTQLFINYQDNSALDGRGFAPIGEVIDGMAVVDKLYAGYGDGPPGGTGVDQSRLTKQGNAYLADKFPQLDFIKKAVIVEP